MKLNLKPQIFARSCTLLASVLVAFALTACGGGNGSGGTPIGGSGGGTSIGGGGSSTGSGSTPVVTNNGSVKLALTTSAGAAATAIPAGGALNATAHITDASGAPVANTVVTYLVSSNVGSLPVSSALTDSSGNAIVSLQAGSVPGAATITASATVVGTNSISGTAAFQSGATGTTAAPTIALALVVANSGCAPNIVTASCPLTATAKVKDATGNAVANTIVTFANTLSYTVLTPSSGTVMTDSTGAATVTLATNGLPSGSANGSAGTVNVATTIAGVTVSAAQNYTLGNTSISLSLSSPAKVNVSSYGTTTVAVQVNSNGAIYKAQPVTVSFSSGCVVAGTAQLAPSVTTVNGVAQVTYTDNGCGQPDTVTASLTGAQSVSAILNVAAPVATSINFVSASPSDASIVLPGTGGTTRSSQATLVFQVVSSRGIPLPLQNVVFTNNNPAAATLNSNSGTTDSSGSVSATVTAVGTGTFAITAALASNATINAISNSVIVSTGTPVQASFTLAASTFNIEGWRLAGTPTTLTSYIADNLGNRVVNGTPVVATTNEGSVGNASGISAGCTTTDGQCSLKFISQNPETYTDTTVTPNVTTYGIATVSFSSTNNTTVPIKGQIQIYMSDPYPFVYSFQGGVWAQINGTNLITTNNCSPNINLVLADLNGNPMPAGTKISVTDNQTGTTFGTVFPAAIQNYGVGQGIVFPYATPNLIVNGQNVVIPYTISSAPPCSATGTHTAVINFSLQTTSPAGVAYQTSLAFQYPTP